MLGFSTELLGSRVSLLDKLRSSRPEWLETLLRFLYNSGGFLVPINIQSLHRLCFAVTTALCTLPAKEVMTNENKRSHKVAGGTGAAAVPADPLPCWMDRWTMQSGSRCGEGGRRTERIVPREPFTAMRRLTEKADSPA